MHKRIKILGIPVDMVNYQRAEETFTNMLKEDGCKQIVTPNSEIIVNATKDNELRKIIESADLVIPDGIGLVYASKILGEPLSERVTGIDFLERIFNILSNNKQSVYFLGAAPGIAKLAAENVMKKYPIIKVNGVHDGFFMEEDELSIVKEINETNTDFLCVALGAPKQEKFIYKYKNELKVKVAIGVGGSLDVLSGNVKRAPDFYCKYGLEWLYRFVKQPSRYKRMAALPVFMFKVMLSPKEKQ